MEPSVNLTDLDIMFVWSVHGGGGDPWQRNQGQVDVLSGLRGGDDHYGARVRGASSQPTKQKFCTLFHYSMLFTKKCL